MNQELLQAISALMFELSWISDITKKKHVESSHDSLFKAFERVVVLSWRCWEDEFIDACKTYPILKEFDKKKAKDKLLREVEVCRKNWRIRTAIRFIEKKKAEREAKSD